MEGRLFRDLFDGSRNSEPNAATKPFPLRPLNFNFEIPQSPAFEEVKGDNEETVYSPVTSLAINFNDRLHTDK